VTLAQRAPEPSESDMRSMLSTRVLAQAATALTSWLGASHVYALEPLDRAPQGSLASSCDASSTLRLCSERAADGAGANGPAAASRCFGCRS
jgi:hypothetical protein